MVWLFITVPPVAETDTSAFCDNARGIVFLDEMECFFFSFSTFDVIDKKGPEMEYFDARTAVIIFMYLYIYT